MKQHLTNLVKSLKPGQSIDIDANILSEIRSYGYSGGTFHPADQILEGILGSAYEFRYWENEMNRSVTFHRLAAPLNSELGVRSYVSPDRRDRCQKLPNGFFKPKS